MTREQARGVVEALEEKFFLESGKLSCPFKDVLCQSVCCMGYRPGQIRNKDHDDDDWFVSDEPHCALIPRR